MAEENKCPQCGKVCKTPQALKAHIQWKHSGGLVPPAKGEREVPIVEEDFATLLKQFRIKEGLAANIAKNVSHTGGAQVFEKPELLFKRLTAWSSDIPPGMRKNLIEQWFAEKGIAIPTDIQQKVEMTTEQLDKVEAETKGGAEAKYIWDTETRQIRIAKKDEQGATLEEAKALKKMAEEDEKKEKAETMGGAEARYIWDTETRQIRIAKKDERGATLEEAKALKKMADEDEKTGAESPFMQDGDGKWVLNPKARVTGVELMAVQFMQQAQAKGEPADPIEAMARAAETWKTLREGLGGGGGTQPAWMTDPVAFIGAIKTITGQEGLGGGGGTLPTWMTDPVAFVGAIKTITGQEGLGGGAGAQPAWMTDPTEFIKTVKAITGDTGGDSALKEALTEMRQSFNEMKEDRERERYAGQQKQIQDISTVLKQTLDTISDLKKGNVGRTEMDIIHEIITGGKEELSGLRKDVKEAFTSSSLPPRKTTEEREGRKRRVKGALKTDQEIEDLGKRLFFPQD